MVRVAAAVVSLHTVNNGSRENSMMWLLSSLTCGDQNLTKQSATKYHSITLNDNLRRLSVDTKVL